MQRYFLDKDKLITKDDIHHILNVMRTKDKTQVEVCSNGTCFLAELNISGKDVSYTKISEVDSNKLKSVTLVQGLPKGDKMETVTKYATIFGAEKIVFVPMVRSIAKMANEDHKLQRLTKISKEAAELAKYSSVPVIEFANSIKSLDLKNKTIILLDENEKDHQIDDVLPQIKNDSVILIVGPEGGIDDKERALLSSLNAIFVSLGKTIYPTELAHIPFLVKF